MTSEWFRSTKYPGANGADQPGNGASILTDVEAFLGRFVAYPSEDARIAHTLWIAHAWAMDAWESTPRIAFLSPEPKSGKTRALEVTEALVPRPVEAVNVTPAYLFRKVGDKGGRPTILFDEIDTVFGPKAKKDNEEVRGLLNAGHRRGAVAGRCSVHGKIVKAEELPAYCAVALAGLGDLPDTILGRSVIIGMRRRAAGESVEPWRHRVHAPQGEPLRDRLAAWMACVATALTDAWPSMPEGIADRDADVWEALLAVADAAGGTWPERARVAAVALVALSRENRASLGIRLLSDTRVVFGDATAMSTASLITALCALPETLWIERNGNPIGERKLSNVFNRYKIRPKVIRLGDSTPRGYTRADFEDAWARYLPPVSLSPRESATSATSATSSGPLSATSAPYPQHAATLEDEPGEPEEPELWSR